MARTAAKLGLFVAVCLGFTLSLAFTIGNIRLFQDSYSLAASFDDVTGLLVNDNVKIAGVVVGKVTGIDVDHGRATVSLEVYDDVTVPSDSKASIRWRNLLGQRYVYLVPGEAGTVLTDGDVIGETESAVDLGELFNRLGPIVAAIDPDDVNDFLDTAVAALDGNEDALRSTLDDLATLTERLAGRDEAIGRLITNTEVVAQAIVDREAQIDTVLDNLVTIANAFSTNTDVLDETVTELGDFSEHLAVLLGGNRAEIDSIVASLDTLVTIVAAKLDNVEGAVEGLDEAAKRLFTASRHGTWLNQIIPCGKIGPLPVDDSCVTGPDQTGGPTNASARGATAITSLIGGSH